jgi:hypothetical protein
MARKAKERSEQDAPAEPELPPAEPIPSASPPSDTNGNGERKPVKVFSYLVGKDTWVLASIWDRLVQLQDGTNFVAYDISIRKRYRDRQKGEMKTLYSFHSSEVYAVVHALTQASAWVLESRAAANSCPF